MSRLLVQDTRDAIPVARNGGIIGAFSRTAALDLLVGLE
jgi:hypothetical protein